jgi:hypothetical protein
MLLVVGLSLLLTPNSVDNDEPDDDAIDPPAKPEKPPEPVKEPPLNR